jgi:MFS family permease
MSGVPLMFSAVTWAVGSWLQGRLPNPNRSVLMGLGLFLVAAGGFGMAGVAADLLPAWASFAAWAAAGLGAGVALTSASVVMLEFTTDADRGSDSASLQLADSSTSALFTAFGGALIAAAANGTISYNHGLSITFLVLASIAAAAIVRAPRLTGNRVRRSPSSRHVELRSYDLS